MKHVLIIAAASVGVAEILSTSRIRAGGLGSGARGDRRLGLYWGRTRKSIELEDETPR